ncbi:MAG: DUF1641 domain-containing protein [Desulfofustis sp.]|nr:DUF1641 domain-containing protein [Desulfofustis sp.]NNK57976.1 DUF1641 domain-containing protein [Desulfofustis sp.]RZW21260.1 MAG: DUF1641 domain-containing protein [Desulfobulbaceae bacterium]
MNDALILEKLDQLSAEVQSLKSDVMQDIRKDLEPVLKDAVPSLSGVLEDIDDRYTKEKVIHLAQNVLTSLDELNDMVDTVKAGMELKGDMMPVVKQVYPSTINFFNDLSGEFQVDELTILLRKLVTNLDSLGEAMDMLKAGVELRDEMVPIVQLMYPRIIRFMKSLHEGEFQAEKLGDLLHTILINIHTLSDLLNMVQPMTEFVKEFTAVMKGSDIMNSVNLWLDSLQQSSGLVKVAGVSWSQMKRLDYNEKQVEEICNAISGLDFTKAEPVGPFTLMKKMRDPKVQSALGFMFMMLETMGTVVLAYQDDKREQENNR